jgi:hypothetical protein
MTIKTLFLSIITLIVFGFAISSCKKKCKIPPEDVKSGDLVKEAIIYGPNSGRKRIVVREDSESPAWKVSTDGGVTRLPVDFDNFVIMNFPVVVDCHTTVVNDIFVDDQLGRVTNTLRINTCNECEDFYAIENYVLIPIFPNHYNLNYVRQ